jgi:hypothetical protein
LYENKIYLKEELIMSKGLKNATQKTMRFVIDSIFKFNPERVYDIKECITLIQHEHYDFLKNELSHLMKIVDIKIAKDIISSGDDGVIENVYYEFW